MKKLSLIIVIALFSINIVSQEIIKEFKINKKYLNFPVNMNQDRQKVLFIQKKDTLTYSVIRITSDKPDYWVFKDMTQYMGKKVKLVFQEMVNGIDMIFQSDQFAGEDSLYKELNRPQYHFSSKRGWNNDPNGLVYLDGEYHLFYQHNPYEIHWENMHWGHAVSTDLVHWEELNDALYPDKLGTMFSGSAVIDKNNTSGWGENALVAAYTAHGKTETQCIAYSNDNGRTFTKYEENPVIKNERFNHPGSRDPKVIWYEPNQEWVMSLYEEAGISFFNSKNLKDWIYQGHLNGFYECPELFELPVDGNPDNKLWVAYSASGTYMLGNFNGKIFKPEFGKYKTFYGSQYAAQTFNQTPDGRRIQIGWGQIHAKGMPFNQMMCFPTELTLRTTNEGVRLFSEPIKEIQKLHTKKYDLSGLNITEVNEKLRQIDNKLLHVIARVESLNGAGISFDYNGNRILDMNSDVINEIQTPLPNPGSLIYNIELLIDKTSVEEYFQNGRLVFVKPLEDPKNDLGLQIIGQANSVKIRDLVVYELRSAWE